MLILGAAVSLVAFALYACVAVALGVLSWRLTRIAPGERSPGYEIAQLVLRTLIVALILAPIVFLILYVPVDHVSSDGSRVLSDKPRLVEDMGAAAALSLGSAAALGSVAAAACFLLLHAGRRQHR